MIQGGVFFGVYRFMVEIFGVESFKVEMSKVEKFLSFLGLKK